MVTKNAEGGVGYHTPINLGEIVFNKLSCITLTGSCTVTDCSVLKNGMSLAPLQPIISSSPPSLGTGEGGGLLLPGTEASAIGGGRIACIARISLSTEGDFNPSSRERREVN